MIQAEIKLYEEPATIVYQTPKQTVKILEYCGYGTKKFTQADLVAERSKAAFLSIKIGSKFRYKATGAVIEVVSYNTDPETCENVDGEPAILRCNRTLGNEPDKVWDFSYSVNELIKNELVEAI